MQEWRGKYAGIPAVFAAPMVDAPVLLAQSRTSVELFLPAPVAAFALWSWGPAGLLVPVGLFVVLPRLRSLFEHNRALHWLWGMGWRRSLALVERVVAGGGRRHRVPTPFARARAIWLRP